MAMLSLQQYNTHLIRDGHISINYIGNCGWAAVTIRPETGYHIWAGTDGYKILFAESLEDVMNKFHFNNTELMPFWLYKDNISNACIIYLYLLFHDEQNHTPRFQKPLLLEIFFET